MSRGHQSGNLGAGVQPAQAFPTEQALSGYAEHVYQEPEGEPPVETNSIRAWRDWPGLRNGQVELRLNNQRAPRVHGLGWGFDPDAGVWRPVRVDSTGALVTAGGPTPPPEPGPPLTQLGGWWRADDAGTVDGASVTSWPDRSGYTQTFGTLAGVTAPTWEASVSSLGNRPAVQFGAGKGLQITSPTGFIGGKHAVTCYIVQQIASFTNSSVFFYGPSALSVFGSCFSIINLNGPDRVGTSIYGCSGMFASNNSAQIVSVRAANNSAWGTSKLTIDGAAVAAVVDNPGLVLDVTNPVQIVCVGGDTTPASFNFDGRIAEILYYHKEHDGTERAETLLYLSERYGIPLV